MVPALRARAWLGLERLARIPTRWRRRTQQRRLLSTFDARMLADIGLTPAERWREVRKPFWVA
ncbi:MAG TPA: DUF1127 domain-containing protein [bacterium]|nr:DUF1127 domain-containing protein [bacterium]